MSILVTRVNRRAFLYKKCYIERYWQYLCHSPPHRELLVTCQVVVEGTLSPRQRALEGVKEVPEHPGDKCVVEDAHQERHQHGGDPFKYEERQEKEEG